MNTILIVEDDTNIHHVLKEILTQEKYRVISAYSGTEALLLLEKENIDCILLDLMLPGVNGEEIIKKINQIPIIVISAKNSPEEKTNCLLMGANDYIIKPFDKKELLARIKVQLRLKNNKRHPLKYRELELLDDSHTLMMKNKKIKLTKTEYAILKQLLKNPSQVITKTKLLELISNDTEDGDELSLKVHISNIRKKIRTITEQEYIESVWGIGFKLYDES